MIHKVIAWWKRRHIVWKVLSAIFVGALLLLLLAWAVLSRRGISESTVLDVSVEEYRRQSDKRKEALLEQDRIGAGQVEDADKRLEEIGREGAKAKTESEKRDEELRNADNWSDLDGELGEARNGGRSGTR